MTREEFAGPARILDGGWPGLFASSDEDAYYFLLDDYAVEDVLRALKALRGSKFRPAASEIVNALTPGRASVPTFDEMFALLFSQRGALAARGVDGTRQRLAGIHPLVASFAETKGIQHLKELPVHDPDDGHWRKTELGEAWAAHVAAMEGRELAMVAQRSERGLRRIDPLAALRPTAGSLESGEDRS